MDAWERGKQLAEKHANGLFVRLKDHGARVIAVILGSPYIREVHWLGEKTADCEETNCPHCAAGVRSSMVASFNIYVPGEGMKILEGPAKLFNALALVRDKYGFEDCCFEITRQGKPKDPKTAYTALPDKKIDAELRAKVKATPLHDLERTAKDEDAQPAREQSRGEAAREPARGQAAREPARGEPARQEHAPSAEPATISPQTVQELIAQLKPLPRQKIDDFLAAFQVKRVREICAADEEQARKAVAKLVGGDDTDEFGA